MDVVQLFLGWCFFSCGCGSPFVVVVALVFLFIDVVHLLWLWVSLFNGCGSSSMGVVYL